MCLLQQQHFIIVAYILDKQDYPPPPLPPTPSAWVSERSALSVCVSRSSHSIIIFVWTGDRKAPLSSEFLT